VFDASGALFDVAPFSLGTNVSEQRPVLLGKRAFPVATAAPSGEI